MPEGAFKGRPSIPDDTVTTLAVTYRLVVPETMLNVVAGLIGRAVINTKEKLAAVEPAAAQIETPAADDTSPILPIHPGLAAYLNSGDPANRLGALVPTLRIAKITRELSALWCTPPGTGITSSLMWKPELSMTGLPHRSRQLSRECNTDGPQRARR